jgi:hypothetical protein
MAMDRRAFVRQAAKSAMALPLSAMALPIAAQTPAAQAPAAPTFLPDARWRATWSAALEVLAGNVRKAPRFDAPILFEGSTYQGAWQECGPHESLVYASLAHAVAPRKDGLTPSEIARNTHRAFFQLQREDGQLPAAVKMSDVGFGQIQMVVPIAATAWDLAQSTHDEAFLQEAYTACSRWDAWLMRYRNTRGTGLIEAFCTYDTGQDNSPRWKGVGNRCPDADARKCVDNASMPRLCPDLSATVFGARVALAAMATALGKHDAGDRWLQQAAALRALIVAKLWCEEDASFYDLDPQGNFVRVRSVANCRVLGEHVLRLDHASERKIFEAMWKRQLHSPHAFWAKYPLTSIAMDDPTFVRPIPRNSWGGASQALTAMRTLRWMEHYGQAAAQRVLMQQWTEAIVRQGTFCQQLDPDTGIFTQPDPGGYSPCALAFLAFAERLHGPRSMQH